MSIPHAAVVQLLIESAPWIGCVPPDVCTASETIQGELLQTRSMETILEDDAHKGHDLPKRYTSNKQKKQRTSSLSGNVIMSKWIEVSSVHCIVAYMLVYQARPSSLACMLHVS